mgnify:FL=1
MKKAIIILLAIAFKGFVIYFLIVAGLEFYKQNLPFYKQNPLVWILIYLPMFMGYESIINVIGTTKKKKNGK